MQSIIDAKPGCYEIKWMFGNKDVIKMLHSYKIEEGSIVQVVIQFKNYVLLGYNDRRILLENEAAQGIKI